MIDFAASVDLVTRDIMFDPQTSGGLLICVASRKAEDLLEKLKKNLNAEVKAIGEVIEEPKGKILVE